MQNYTQLFNYDELGNLQTMQSQGRWTRNYVYDTVTNRLLRHEAGNPVYTYDAHGNMTTMPHLTALTWNYADLLRSASNGTFTSCYVYNAGGDRTRKVVVKGNIREERLYLGNYELYRKYVNNTLDTERQTLHIADDQHRFALIDRLTVNNGATLTTPTVAVRYQYDNHLGSASLELDQNAAIISYEEYHPFGTTSYRSGRTETEVALKRYKYVGKERDEETGLYYYGARYYAAWIARFVSVDPLQLKYPELSPYQYASNRPITAIDLDGLEGVIKVTGDWWQNRIKEHLGKGEDFNQVLKAFNTALSGTTKTLEDIPKSDRKRAEKDWGNKSPATFIPDKDMTGYKIIYGTDDEGNELSFTINIQRINKQHLKQNEKLTAESTTVLDMLKSWLKGILPKFGGASEKNTSGGGFHFTWSIGQGQESRKADMNVNSVEIDEIMDVLSTAKSASSKPPENVIEYMGKVIDAISVLINVSNNTNIKTDQKGSKDKKTLDPNEKIILLYPTYQINGVKTTDMLWIYRKDSAVKAKALQDEFDKKSQYR